MGRSIAFAISAKARQASGTILSIIGLSARGRDCALRSRFVTLPASSYSVGAGITTSAYCALAFR